MAMILNIGQASQVGKIARGKPLPESLGFGLKEEREEAFCVMVADGLSATLAFQKAFRKDARGDHTSLFTLMQQPRIRDRVSAILRERAMSPAVTLGEVTEMLDRVYAHAMCNEELNAAHNAAFSLARLYGLVIDRAQIDVVRRPSREPDAPVEAELGTWIDSLPVVSADTPADISDIPRNRRNGGDVIEATAFGSDLDGGGGGAPTVGAHSDRPSLSDEGIPKAADLFG